ncbi:cobalt/nickel transport system ATP-binding protein [Rhodobium orientis]|uniref:Energy-coupling factor ABC transporter ATP-binding protein n=1 Tax=Rhodobium orientis TaxID=34017 RepID=A0A327JU15_9HYPH|nr:ABC transporter ATP-binding protein [Rhodobium orientis]MBB4301260.1 cobalt/nickel transport system ATP-binding protein [Rhodobium orientis]MBK5951149.1 energy-coupling factor ABC transporter ATP-binding protein [Rhodobium orientis]RAI29979.1 energy-coupling factor ABC transporter ATP-binding protein [Rhodobium orientis]
MPLFELRDIHFAYRSGPPVLSEVSLDLEPGERLAIAGPNGAGKSTLLHIMVGLLKPVRGSVHAFGEERRAEADFHEVRRLAGLVFQDPDDQLFCPTVAEDVAFGPLNLGKSRKEAMAIVDDVLDRLRLSDFRNRITHKLSGGEKRLITIAAVLAMEPEVLLLDEPSNALDEETCARLIEILTGLPQAMVLVSHDRPFREAVATRTLALRGGRLEAVPH